MRDDGRDDTHEIDIIPSDERAPIVFNVIDAELARNLFGMFTMGAGDRNDARILAVSEPGNLRRAREPRANDADANCLCDNQPFRFSCFLPLPREIQLRS